MACEDPETSGSVLVGSTSEGWKAECQMGTKATCVRRLLQGVNDLKSTIPTWGSRDFPSSNHGS